MRQALGGHAVVEAVLPLRRAATGSSGDPGAAAAAARSAGTAATTTGRTSTTPTSSRCRTSGSTRGTRRGTSRSTASPLALVDSEFAKDQLVLLLREWYMHPNGQLPAYEWAFGDVNPPVHAWAAWRVYKIEKQRTRRGRPRVPRARLPQAAAQLHVVGEPQGRRGQQRLPGRLPRPRQHRRLRPQRAAADRRPPRAVRRHQLDGDVLPQPAAHRARARAATTRPTRTSPASSSSTSSTSPHAMNNLRRRRASAVGRGGRLLLRRAAPAGRRRTFR